MVRGTAKDPDDALEINAIAKKDFIHVGIEECNTGHRLGHGFMVHIYLSLK